MERYPLCNESDISVGDMKKFIVNDEEVLVYHLDDGFYATQSRCTHLHGALENGRILDGDKILCPVHRSCFNIRTGEVIQWANFPPGIQLLSIIKRKKDLRTYNISHDGGKIFIEL